ncbi:MAG: DUF4389 domain-containing protein [Methylovulum sp.]|nr:MAG: DUF4389 domain-containing protein [Methylovulum sp.]
MDEQINANLKQISTWKRIFFMLIFSIIGELVRMLLWAVVILQIASTLLTGKPNENILNFGRNLSLYSYHILLFMTFNTDTLPFPFSDWNVTAELQLTEAGTPKE